jgi:hypothetical protein
MTSLSTGEASFRMVDAYRLYPNAIKNLSRCGQGYLLSDAGLKPIAYGLLPPLSAEYVLGRKQQREARGLGLYETSQESMVQRAVRTSRQNRVTRFGASQFVFPMTR